MGKKKVIYYRYMITHHTKGVQTHLSDSIPKISRVTMPRRTTRAIQMKGFSWITSKSHRGMPPERLRWIQGKTSLRIIERLEGRSEPSKKNETKSHRGMPPERLRWIQGKTSLSNIERLEGAFWLIYSLALYSIYSRTSKLIWLSGGSIKELSFNLFSFEWDFAHGS